MTTVIATVPVNNFVVTEATTTPLTIVVDNTSVLVESPPTTTVIQLAGVGPQGPPGTPGPPGLKYATDIIGDNTTVSYNIEHNLGTYDVNIIVRDPSNQGSEVEAEKSTPDVNSATIKFLEPPTAGVVYRAIVFG